MACLKIILKFGYIFQKYINLSQAIFGKDTALSPLAVAGRSVVSSAAVASV